MARQPEVFVRSLSGGEGQRLVRSAHTSRDRVRQRRAMILLASTQGRSAEAIARLLEGSVDYVRDVIQAFNAHGFEALDWAPNGAGTGPRAIAGTISGAIAASPWPAPETWANRSPASRRATGPRLQLPRPSPAAARTGNELPAQYAPALTRSRVGRQEQPGPRHHHAPRDEEELWVEECRRLVLQPPPDWAASRAPGRPGFGPPAPAHWVRHESSPATVDTHESANGGLPRDEVRDVGKVYPPERAGLTGDERQRLCELERENARLRKERELLKAAAFFAAESQRT